MIDDGFAAMLIFGLLFYAIFIIWIPPLLLSWLICKFAGIKDIASKKRFRTWVFVYFYALHPILPLLIALDLTTDETNKKGNEWIIYPFASALAVTGFILLTKRLVARYRKNPVKYSGRVNKYHQSKMELLDDLIVILPALLAGGFVFLSAILANISS